MTLILTAATRDLIVQSADVRMSYAHGYSDSRAQKVFSITRFAWGGTVAFCGIGHTGRLEVSEWLAKKIFELPLETPSALISNLESANAWLDSLPPPQDKRIRSSSAGSTASVRSSLWCQTSRACTPLNRCELRYRQ